MLQPTDFATSETPLSVARRLLLRKCSS